MGKNTTFSIEQIYHLFGYKNEDLKLDDVFAALLFAIAVPDFWGNYAYGYCPSTTDDSQYVNFLMNVYPKLETAKNELPKYLGKGFQFKAMLRLDTKMRMFELKKFEFRLIPWYHFIKFVRTYYELRKMANEQVLVQTVFGYLEYRANKTGIHINNLHKQFTAYATEFPKQLMDEE